MRRAAINIPAFLVVTVTGLCWAFFAEAKPPGPQTFCDTYPTAPACVGSVPDCKACHDQSSGPPARNFFGQAVEAELLPGQARPLSDADFSNALPGALIAVEQLDSDGDGFTNYDEILAGTDPADGLSLPSSGGCAGEPNPDFDVCNYDPRYTFKKIHVDFCGRNPTLSEMDDFDAMSRDAQVLILDDVLDTCLDSDFWTAEDGVVWSLAHRKIRPIFGLRGAVDPAQQGSLPIFGDYEDDYSLFVYTQIDGNDARDVLLADYHVLRNEQTGEYEQVANRNAGLSLANLVLVGQFTVQDRRQGLMTTRWFQSLNTMVTPVPRTTAAQVYRSFLGLDIARMEGLIPISNEPVDYDGRGVTQPTCAACHSTLDPLTYPFTRYDALGYRANRMTQAGFPGVPEDGAVLGQPVADLNEWAQVAANSDEFASATVHDYWMILMGVEPDQDTQKDFQQLWQDLRGTHNYNVEAMLHDFIKTEAYGAP